MYVCVYVCMYKSPGYCPQLCVGSRAYMSTSNFAHVESLHSDTGEIVSILSVCVSVNCCVREESSAMVLSKVKRAMGSFWCMYVCMCVYVCLDV
jgi:hypothetical protein